jgi:hypothetical protein
MLASLDFALRAWFGVDGSLWKGGVRIDLDQIQSLVQSLGSMSADMSGTTDDEGY